MLDSFSILKGFPMRTGMVLATIISTCQHLGDLSDSVNRCWVTREWSYKIGHGEKSHFSRSCFSPCPLPPYGSNALVPCPSPWPWKCPVLSLWWAINFPWCIWGGLPSGLCCLHSPGSPEKVFALNYLSDKIITLHTLLIPEKKKLRFWQLRVKIYNLFNDIF